MAGPASHYAPPSAPVHRSTRRCNWAPGLRAGARPRTLRCTLRACRCARTSRRCCSGVCARTTCTTCSRRTRTPSIAASLSRRRPPPSSCSSSLCPTCCTTTTRRCARSLTSTSPTIGSAAAARLMPESDSRTFRLMQLIVLDECLFSIAGHFGVHGNDLLPDRLLDAVQSCDGGSQ